MIAATASRPWRKSRARALDRGNRILRPQDKGHIMRIFHALSLLATLSVAASAVSAQTAPGPHGIRTTNTVVSPKGTHTNAVDIADSGARTGRGSDTIIRTNGNHQPIRCAGGGLTVEGNGNRLNVRGCSVVVVSGSHNQLDVDFGRKGQLRVSGHRNMVTWTADRSVHIAVAPLGSQNVVRRR